MQSSNVWDVKSKEEVRGERNALRGVNLTSLEIDWVCLKMEGEGNEVSMKDMFFLSTEYLKESTQRANPGVQPETHNARGPNHQCQVFERKKKS